MGKPAMVFTILMPSMLPVKVNTSAAPPIMRPHISFVGTGASSISPASLNVIKETVEVIESASVTKETITSSKTTGLSKNERGMASMTLSIMASLPYVSMYSKSEAHPAKSTLSA